MDEQPHEERNNANERQLHLDSRDLENLEPGALPRLRESSAESLLGGAAQDEQVERKNDSTHIDPRLLETLTEIDSDTQPRPDSPFQSLEGSLETDAPERAQNPAIDLQYHPVRPHRRLRLMDC